MLRVIHLRAITEAVTVLVGSPRFFIVETDCIDSKLRQGVKLTWLRDAIVVCILPQAEVRKDCIAAINQTIAVTAVSRFIELSKCEKPVPVYGRRLWREVAKQFNTVVDRAVGAAVERKERIIGASSRPSEAWGTSVTGSGVTPPPDRATISSSTKANQTRIMESSSRCGFRLMPTILPRGFQYKPKVVAKLT